MSFDESSDEDSSAASSNHVDDNNGELVRLKNECKAMVTFIKRLRAEEQDLREKNVMLARQALLCGFQMESLEAPPPKRRVKSSAVRKEDKAAS